MAPTMLTRDPTTIRQFLATARQAGWTDDFPARESRATLRHPDGTEIAIREIVCRDGRRRIETSTLERPENAGSILVLDGDRFMDDVELAALHLGSHASGHPPS